MPPREVPAAGDGWLRIIHPDETSASIGRHADDAADAEARAEAARARAARLRRLADGLDQGDRADEQAASALDGATVTSDDAESESAPPRGHGLRRTARPSRKATVVSGAIMVICVSLAASGLVGWQHREAVVRRQHAAEFAATARNGIVTMMSIDPAKAREEMQRFADDTTGIFKMSFLMGAEDLIKAVEQWKLSTKAAVQAVGVQSMTADSALVLVAARSEITQPGDKPSSRLLRAVVSIQRDAGQLKVSGVEFVP